MQLVLDGTKQAPASMSVITAQDIMKIARVPWLTSLLNQRVLNLAFDSTRAGRQMISIRGMDSDYTLIMVNGQAV